MRWPFTGRKKRLRLVLATRHREVLARVWNMDEVTVMEVITSTGLLAALERAHLVIASEEDLVDVGVLPARAVEIAATSGVPFARPEDFLAEPDRYLADARAFRGDVKALLPRSVAFTSLDSGGVGKTTLTLNLALAVARRTTMPVLVVELTRAASGLLPILAARDAEGPFPTAYDILTAGERPGVWQAGDARITVVPMEGRNVHLMNADDFGGLLDRLRAEHVLTVVDAVQPHPLWPAVQERADRIFILAAAGRPETVANARALQQDIPSAHIVLNMARTLDRALASGGEMLVVPHSRAVAGLRGEQDMAPLLRIIWPYYRFR